MPGAWLHTTDSHVRASWLAAPCVASERIRLDGMAQRKAMRKETFYKSFAEVLPLEHRFGVPEEQPTVSAAAPCEGAAAAKEASVRGLRTCRGRRCISL